MLRFSYEIYNICVSKKINLGASIFQENLDETQFYILEHDFMISHGHCYLWLMFVPAQRND